MMTALTEAKLRQITGTGKMRRLYAGDGVFAQVSPKGVISWALKYREGGKEKRHPLGRWPDVSLASAKRKARAFRVDLERGEHAATGGESFATIADEWFKVNAPGMAPRHAAGVTRYLNACKGAFGSTAIGDVTPADVLAVIRKYEAQGKHETAHRIRIYASVVFQFAVATERARFDPASPLKARGVMAAKPRSVGHVAMPLPDIKPFLEALADSKAGPSARLALRFAVLTALRTNEILGLQWADVANDGASLTIPADRMKGGRAHSVTLSRQARATLAGIKRISEGRPFVFPGRDPDGPLSNMSLAVALKRAYSGRATVHGFRAAFSTWAHSTDAAPLVVERCLAHAQGDKIAAAYNRHAFNAEAAALWQSWADVVAP